MLRELLHARDAGRLGQVNTETVRTVGLRWAREDRPKKVRQSTASGYEAILRLYVFPTLGNVRICDLKPRHVEQIINVLIHEKKSDSTINSARRALHGMCTYAVRMEIIPTNPVASTETVKRQASGKTQVKTPWSVTEAVSALQAARNDPTMDCFVHLMLYLGLRPGEALGLRWTDIDLESGMLHVTGTLREERRIAPDGKGVVRNVRNAPKTSSSKRALQLHPELTRALVRQQLRLKDWEYEAGTKWSDTGYVITTRIGTELSHANNRKNFYKFLGMNGLRQIRPHDMRHVAAKTALEADIRIEDVSQALGHTRIDTTKQIYAGHVQRLNDRFSAGIGDLWNVSTLRTIFEAEQSDGIEYSR
jgi:integrase